MASKQILEANQKFLGKHIPTIGDKKGYFISFEGVDGSGKGTQVALLKEALEKSGFNVTVVRDPGGTVIGESIRAITHDLANKGMAPETELFLMNAARAQLVKEKIKPALDNGEVVIADRYYHSTIVYQGFGRGLNPVFIKAAVQFATSDVVPDVTFMLYLDAELAAARKADRATTDRFEQEDAAFQARVAKGYKWLQDQELATNHKIIAINGGGTVEGVHTEIYRCAASRISTLKPGQLDLVKQIVK